MNQNFVRIGARFINLNHVAYVYKFGSKVLIGFTMPRIIAPDGDVLDHEMEFSGNDAELFWQHLEKWDVEKPHIEWRD